MSALAETLPPPAPQALEARFVDACGVRCTLGASGAYEGRGVSGLTVRIEPRDRGWWACRVMAGERHDVLVGMGRSMHEAIGEVEWLMPQMVDALRQMTEAMQAGAVVGERRSR